MLLLVLVNMDVINKIFSKILSDLHENKLKTKILC